jgi:hypothetical protein
VRGDDEQSGHLFSYLSPEQRVPADHPLRAIRTMTDNARLSPRFDAIYATTGRPSIPPEDAAHAGGHAPYCTEEAQPHARCADDAACGLCDQPTREGSGSKKSSAG